MKKLCINEIGGYFELDLKKGDEYHKDAIHLNTGRNALELILRIKKYKKVYMPYYICDVVLEPYKKLNIDVGFYFIDNSLQPIFDFSRIKEDEGFLYVNYFGLKDSYVCKIAKECKNLIVDNSQSFYSVPIPNVPTFYSCRKFFGVPDGAYLYLDGASDADFPLDHSKDRLAFLLKRLETGADSGFHDFKANEKGLSGQPIKRMSKITRSILGSIDYELSRKKRFNNFLYLHKHLSGSNALKIQVKRCAIPLVYPFLSNRTNLKKYLIDQNIFIATYWPSVLQSTDVNSFEHCLADQVVCLPVDQRYGKCEMDKILDIIFVDK